MDARDRPVKSRLDSQRRRPGDISQQRFRSDSRQADDEDLASRGPGMKVINEQRIHLRKDTPSATESEHSEKKVRGVRPGSP